MYGVSATAILGSIERARSMSEICLDDLEEALSRFALFDCVFGFTAVFVLEIDHVDLWQSDQLM